MNSLRWFALSLWGFAVTIFLAGCGNETMQQPIVVTLGVTPATVQPGATAQFSATIINDSSNKGINWSVSCAAADCGSVSLTKTASGVPTTYTAPAIPPAGDLTVETRRSLLTTPALHRRLPSSKSDAGSPAQDLIWLEAASQVTALLRKYDSLAMWQASAALWPKTVSSVTC